MITHILLMSFLFLKSLSWSSVRLLEMARLAREFWTTSWIDSTWGRRERPVAHGTLIIMLAKERYMYVLPQAHFNKNSRMKLLGGQLKLWPFWPSLCLLPQNPGPSLCLLAQNPGPSLPLLASSPFWRPWTLPPSACLLAQDPGPSLCLPASSPFWRPWTLPLPAC